LGGREGEIVTIRVTWFDLNMLGATVVRGVPEVREQKCELLMVLIPDFEGERSHDTHVRTARAIVHEVERDPMFVARSECGREFDRSQLHLEWHRGCRTAHAKNQYQRCKCTETLHPLPPNASAKRLRRARAAVAA